MIILGVMLSMEDSVLSPIAAIVIAVILSATFAPSPYYCDFCGAEFMIEKAHDIHISICKYNPESEYYGGEREMDEELMKGVDKTAREFVERRKPLEKQLQGIRRELSKLNERVDALEKR